MSALYYVGDEASGAGFRLAGARVIVPRDGEEAAALQAARTDASLVLVSASAAARIPDQALRAARAALAPLVLVVPDLRDGTRPPELAARLRRELGLEADR